MALPCKLSKQQLRTIQVNRAAALKRRLGRLQKEFEENQCLRQGFLHDLAELARVEIDLNRKKTEILVDILGDLLSFQRDTLVELYNQEVASGRGKRRKVVLDLSDSEDGSRNVDISPGQRGGANPVCAGGTQGENGGPSSAEGGKPAEPASNDAATGETGDESTQ